jgi:hypothetical protein
VDELHARFDAQRDAVRSGVARLDTEFWMALDDVRVFALVFGSAYLMITTDRNHPIRVYNGPDIHHYKSPEKFKKKYKGPPLTKGVAFGGAHFNPLVLQGRN